MCIFWILNLRANTFFKSYFYHFIEKLLCFEANSFIEKINGKTFVHKVFIKIGMQF